ARLPEITGTSAYKPLADNTVRFALNVWAGWGPIILANEGFKPGKIWKTPDGKEFKVELVLIDDPVAMRNAYAAGEIHIGWATLDMVPLFVDGFAKAGDNRVMPRIYQQIDWSNGGDGIVVRENVRGVADLRGKKLVLAQNSPSQYFALNMLVAGGLQPSEVEMVYTNTAFEAARALMAAGYDIPAKDAMTMFADAHSTNWAENYQFFLNQNNPTNFERVWKQAYYLYRRIGSIVNPPVPFDQIMDFSVIEKLGREEKYRSQKDEYQITLAPKTVSEIKAESEEILTNTVVIHFYPNSWDLRKKVTKKVGDKEVEESYDPTVDMVLEDIAKLTEQFGAARVIIEGHTDATMRGLVPAAMVKDLSMNRANAVKEALVEKYNLLPNKFSVVGMGWEKPADSTDPMNHAKNRRVEIKVYPAEKQ
ncbi:MAG: phosphate ABC transporter substrate-binding/OmpA family protein, partial [Planctomycetia bacterium]|nr:phosphate ABC transporter substrate-binding/OmpA family protein [Planctomycetia bacterium]